MFSWRDAATRRAAALTALMPLLAAAPAATAPVGYPGIGRTATPAEVAAWDTDVRPDFKGLPKGTGSVVAGMAVWEGQCASCHGVFGESNAVFSPIVGGTTDDDIRSGHVARLNDPAYPGRSTMMKLPTVSTLWDTIARSMPWTQPKSLGTDEVFAVTAYILNLAGVLPDNFVLTDANIAEVQRRIPNRNGMTTQHALWPGAGFGPRRAPDVSARPCMARCGPEPTLASVYPDSARGSHGNLAEQNRRAGAQHGVDTGRAATAVGAGAAALAAIALMQKNGCGACHAIDSRIVGPGFREVANKYAGRADAQAHLMGRIRSGGSGVWGGVAMPPQALSEADAGVIAQWLAEGARK